MKKLIRKGLLFICLILVSKTIFSQTAFEYTYDAAGNRTVRALVPLKSATIDTTVIVENDTIPQNSPQGKNNLSKKNEQNGAVSEGIITLYPNPTAGVVQVLLDTCNDQSTIEIWVYDIKGTFLFKKNSTAKQTEIDLLSRPAGTYLVNIVMNGKVSGWKIIKE